MRLNLHLCLQTEVLLFLFPNSSKFYKNTKNKGYVYLFMSGVYGFIFYHIFLLYYQVP